MSLPSVSVVVRSANERTLSLCLNRLKQEISITTNFIFTDIYVVSADNFPDVLNMSINYGIRTARDWNLIIDADVVVIDGALSELMSWALNLPIEVSVVQPHVQDKILGYNRPAGVHLYRSEYLVELSDMIEMFRYDKRPETSLLLEYERISGRYFVNIPILFGYHDFEQSYKDLIRKSFLHGIKHSSISKSLLDYWFTCYQISRDQDYLVIMHGYLFGLNSHKKSTISSTDEDVTNIYNLFKEIEKPILDVTKFSSSNSLSFGLTCKNNLSLKSVLEFPVIRNIGLKTKSYYVIKMLISLGIVKIIKQSIWFLCKKIL